MSLKLIRLFFDWSGIEGQTDGISPIQQDFIPYRAAAHIDEKKRNEFAARSGSFTYDTTIRSLVLALFPSRE